MQNSTDFLQSIQVRYPLQAHSDYGLAKLLGLTRSAISSHRTGKVRAFGDETAMRIAELLDMEPAYVLACLAAERAKRPDVAKVWKKVAGGFAALLLAVVLIGQPTPVSASLRPNNIHYTKYARRWMAWLLAAALGLSAPLVQAADPWSSADKSLEAVYLLTVAIDWGQTLDIENHANLYETNRILGKHPTRGEINAYFLGAAALHVAAVHVLPARWRPALQYVTLGFQVSTIKNNARLGLTLNF